jgi:ElaB/YqjD/DUF883 family membrane-anchored ribosome-binding protein
MALARHVLLHSQEHTMQGNATSFNDDIEAAASTVSEQVSDTTREIRNKASDVGSAASDRIDKNRDAAADGIDKAASALHENAESLPGGEKVARVAHTAADKLGASAQYIREHDSTRMMADVQRLVKNNPGPSLLVAALAGFLVGRAFHRNN